MTVLSIVVLVLNDLVLKAAYPGVLTGKLSDVAGLVMMPALLAVPLLWLARFLPPAVRSTAVRPTAVRPTAVRPTAVRPTAGSVTVAAGVAVALTGIGFAVVKATGPGAAAASALWSTLGGPSVILADRTDLLALPALGIAWWVWSRVLRGRARPRSASPWTLPVLLAAVFAVSATSPAMHELAAGVEERDGVFRLGTTQGSQSAGSGRWTWTLMPESMTWSRVPEPPRTASPESGQPSSLSTTKRSKRACVREMPHRCYRVVSGHLRVESSIDGGRTWRTAWEITDEQREGLLPEYPDIRDVGDELSSRAIAVAATPGGTEHVVVVANGRDGFVTYDSRAERWKRVGFLAGSPPAVPTPVKPTVHSLLWGLAGAVLCLGLSIEIVGRRRVQSGSRRHVDKLGLGLAAAGIALLYIAVGWWYSTSRPDLLPEGVIGAVGVAGAASTVGGLALWCAVVRQQGMATPRQLGVASLMAVITGWLIWLVLEDPLDLPVASPVVVVGLLLVLALGTVAATRLAIKAGQPTP